ncbi:MAG TPA: ABC transporter permease [Fimbriiglobus sp.]|jgi:ABC transporter DrrB family efflux protein
MPAWTIAAKDVRLLLRDPRAAVILLVMPVVLILVLGLSIGEAFGKKPDDRIRISVVNLDAATPHDATGFPPKRWSEIVLDDLSGTADIRVELIPTREEAERMVRRGERAAVIVFEPDFGEKVHRCSFVGPPFKENPINPLYRDGLNVSAVGVTILRDPTQPVAAAVIEQVVQVTLVRVIVPWMIGQAFEQIGTKPFMEKMEKYIPALVLAYPVISREKLGQGIQRGIEGYFNKFRFKAKTWAGLTNSEPAPPRTGNVTAYQADGTGVIRRGAARYQVLVPSYTVTFAFFLVLTTGWLFVAERRHGTIARLRAAPIARWQILLGKVIPCLIISLFQGAFLLLAGRVVFGMNWGPRPELLIPVVICTSLAAVGLSVLVAGVSRTETQVAVYGTLLVLVLAGVSGSLMPRDLMPEEMRKISKATPHAWALEAYSQLLANPEPQADLVWQSCFVLVGFALVFFLLAWWRMRLD